MFPLFLSCFGRILFILSGNYNIHKSLNELNFGQILPWTTELPRLDRSKNQCCYFSSAVFHSILFILAGNDDIHESSKFGQIRPPTAELAALERLKNPHRLITGKTVLPLFLRVF